MMSEMEENCSKFILVYLEKNSKIAIKLHNNKLSYLSKLVFIICVFNWLRLLQLIS